MEEGVGILAWDDIKSHWSGAKIEVCHPKRDYHRWVTLQPSPPILPCQEVSIGDGTYPHLARRVKEYWGLKLEDEKTGPGQFLPA